MMTSRERVQVVFAHQEPDRVPCWCGASPELWDKMKRVLGLSDEALRIRLGDDFRRVFARYTGPAPDLHDDQTWQSPFGVRRHGLGYGHPVEHPLANATVKEIHEYSWPGPAWIDVSAVREDALKYSRQYAVLGGDWSPFWHDVIDLLGMETMYMKMYDEPELVKAVFGHVVDYYFEVNRRIFEAAADALDIFFIGNDFGSQTGPLLGTSLFDEFVLPHLKRLIDLGHQYHLNVMLHCCGGFVPLIPMMIEAGLDAVHAVQPCCRGMDLHQLKKSFGDKLVFNGGIDSQHVLIDGTPDSVREATRKTLSIMMPRGGYIAGASHDTILAETPVENILAMFDTICEFGRYEKYRG